MNILLVTADLAVQQSLRSFAAQTNEHAVSVCSNLDAAQEHIKATQHALTTIVDFGTPELGGLRAIGQFAKRHSKTRLILLMHDSSHAVAREALRLGVTACIPADLPQHMLGHALSLSQGHQKLVLLPPEDNPTHSDEIEALSRREQQILTLLCDGQQNKEIAHAFGIQEVTVKMHMRSVIRKLGANNRTHAAMIAQQLGLV